MKKTLLSKLLFKEKYGIDIRSNDEHVAVHAPDGEGVLIIRNWYEHDVMVLNVFTDPDEFTTYEQHQLGLVTKEEHERELARLRTAKMFKKEQDEKDLLRELFEKYPQVASELMDD